MRFAIPSLTLLLVLSIGQDCGADDNGFVSLVDQKLSNFNTEGNWKVDKAGVVTLTPRPGEKGWSRYKSYLWLKKTYKDFTIDLEYKHPKGGNSGVYFRVGDSSKGDKPHFEVQILDSHGKKGKLGHHDCGGIIGIGGPMTNAANPAGEWNRLVITHKGNHIHATLNGKLIQDLEVPEAAAKNRPTPGHVGLQDHGQPFSVRNIRIKQLD